VLGAADLTNYQADGVLARGQGAHWAGYAARKTASTRSRRPISLRFCRSTACPGEESNLGQGPGEDIEDGLGLYRGEWSAFVAVCDADVVDDGRGFQHCWQVARVRRV